MTTKTGTPLRVTQPMSERVLAELREASIEDVNQAVAHGKAAFPALPCTDARDRARLLATHTRSISASNFVLFAPSSSATLSAADRYGAAPELPGLGVELDESIVERNLGVGVGDLSRVQ